MYLTLLMGVLTRGYILFHCGLAMIQAGQVVMAFITGWLMLGEQGYVFGRVGSYR